MDRNWTPLIVPLGPQLQHMAERIYWARRSRPGWLAAADPITARVAALLAPAASRYHRVEVSDRILGVPRHAAADELIAPGPSDEREPLPVAVRDRLRVNVGEAADALRIHDDDRAHRIADEHRADAVADGPDVYFRRGRYRPHDADGFALLAHEATHVSHSLRPNANWRRPMLSEVAAEERVATAVERHARRPVAAGGDRMAGVAAPARLAERSASPVAARPMKADVGRELDGNPPSPPIDLEQLRQTLSRDLMRQIRAELERGG